MKTQRSDDDPLRDFDAWERWWPENEVRRTLVFATLVGAIIGFFFGFLRWGL